MEDLNEFAREVHENAVAHGWWEEDRSFGEIIALCHSELSEALEEYRDSRAMLYYKCNSGGLCVDDMQNKYATCGSRHKGCKNTKPEGIAVELADCIIRILDWCGKNGVDIDKITRRTAGRVPSADGVSFGTVIAGLHGVLSLALLEYVDRKSGMGTAIAGIYKWAETNAVDMDAMLRIKHEYNKSRPYRHNGKVI